MTIPSASAVKKAGSTLRKASRGEPLGQGAVEGAINVVQLHRAAHQKPLVHANNGLRSMARTAGCNAQVTQRLKRMSTILDKLKREPKLALDRMQDIGGCRAVVDDLDELWKLRARILRNHHPIREADYVSKPRSSGYRGIHLILQYGPEKKPIEVQLRTQTMHSWAMLVESFSSVSGVNYKQDGDSGFQRMAELLSQIFALDEANLPVTGELIGTYNDLRRELFPSNNQE